MYYRETYDALCLVDLEPGIMDVIMDVADGPGVRARQHCHGAWGAGNNWAKGHFTEDADSSTRSSTRQRQGLGDGHDAAARHKTR